MRNKPEIKLNENGFCSLSNNQVVRPMGAIKNKLRASAACLVNARCYILGGLQLFRGMTLGCPTNFLIP